MKNSDKQAYREYWKNSYPKDLAVRTHAAEKVLGYLLAAPELLNARYIAVFSVRDWEIDLSAIAMRFPKKCAFPLIHKKEGTIDFWIPKTQDAFQKGHVGILEPVAEKSELVPHWDERDLVLTPGLAFDLKGGRIGSGKGYYDRFFGAFPRSKKWGIAYHQQISDHDLPQGPGDFRLDGVCTEKGLFRF